MYKRQRLNDAEAAKLEAALAFDGRSRSEFIRSAIHEAVAASIDTAVKAKQIGDDTSRLT